MTAVRADIVALIVDIDLEKSTWPSVLVHHDGRPFTEDEAQLVGEAGRAELAAAAQYASAAMEYHEGMLAAYDRLEELTEPYFNRLPPYATLRSVRALMTPAERAELAELMDRLAPDGELHLRGPR